MATEVPGTGASRLELSVQGAGAGLALFDPNTIAGLWEFSTDIGLYDTIATAYEHMQDHYEPGRLNAVVVLTDGANDDDGLTLKQLQAKLHDLVDPEREIYVLVVGYGPETDFDALNAITAITDGKLYALQRPEDIRNVFIDVQTRGVSG